MATLNLKGMDVDALMALRTKISDELGGRRTELQEQIARLENAVHGSGGKTLRKGKARSSSLAGRKVAPKYRDKAGNTWAGRGAQPVWLTAAIKAGKKREDFLIDKAGAPKVRKAAKKRKKK
jgi:DNA-binding protein H-NS